MPDAIDQAPSSQPAQTEVNTGMKLEYYNAAAKGSIQIFNGIVEPLDSLLTPNKNTILHIYLTALTNKPESTTRNFVKEILHKCQSLLWQPNAKDETPLHIAARYGHATIVKDLIECAESLDRQDLESGSNANNANAVKKMLEKKNKEKDTALHEAVRNEHLEVVKLLIRKGRNFSYSANDAGETPLYIAVERNFKNMVTEVLNKCTSLAHGGPLGRTTLHAAIIWDDQEMTDEILKILVAQGQSELSNKADQEGSTPLHCAAYFDSIKTVRLLLNFDRNAAYMKDVKGRTALHIAAHRGHDKIMESILSICPDCSELVDDRGWNALHFAVNSSRWSKDVVQVILDTPMLNNLLNEKDANGNTPLHLHSKSSQYLEALICDNRVDKMAFNNQNLDAYDIALTNAELSNEKFREIRSQTRKKYMRSEQFRQFFKDDLTKKMRKFIDLEDFMANRKFLRERFISMMEKAYQIHLVADTLIATVTFAAGISMPGGFIDKDGTHPGSAILMKNTAFRAFVIIDTIAMVQSCTAAFILLFMPLLFDVQNPTNLSFLLAILAFCFTISAMGATVLAFVTGTYAVLMHSLDLAIATCIIGLCFFIPGFFISIRSSRHLRKMWDTVIPWNTLKEKSKKVELKKEYHWNTSKEKSKRFKIKKEYSPHIL